jgi:hypothetical protein
MLDWRGGNVSIKKRNEGGTNRAFKASYGNPTYGAQGVNWAEMATYGAAIYGEEARKEPILATYGESLKNP